MAKSLQVAEKSHSTLGASKASRWWACPGSVRLTAHIRDETSEYAREGTAAHALVELALRNNVDCVTYLGTTLEGFAVDDAMVDHAQIFVDYCRSLSQTATKVWIEKQFNLSRLNPPEPMYGTADFVAYDATARILEVVDLKFGAGVVVDVFENKQLLYYALGVALELDTDCDADRVKVTIVQPRATHQDGMIRSFEISFVELLGFANELIAAARRTQDVDAPLVAGPHCRFCPASGRCPAQLASAQNAAMVEFSSMPVDLPPYPALVPISTLAEWQGKFHLLEAWMKSVTGRLQSELEAGGAVPGLKLVARRANRSWVSESETQQWLESKGYTAEDFMKMELKSPAQIEKVVGKKNLPVDLTQKVSSGYTMVPVDDARPAVVLERGEEFGAIMAESEN